MRHNVSICATSFLYIYGVLTWHCLLQHSLVHICYLTHCHDTTHSYVITHPYVQATQVALRPTTTTLVLLPSAVLACALLAMVCECVCERERDSGRMRKRARVCECVCECCFYRQCWHTPWSLWCVCVCCVCVLCVCVYVCETKRESGSVKECVCRLYQRRCYASCSQVCACV